MGDLTNAETGSQTPLNTERPPLPPAEAPVSPKPINWALWATVAQAIATVVLVGITAYYADLTRRNVQATEKMVAATEKMVAVQVEPVVTLDTPPAPEGSLVLLLSNTGSTPVLDVVVQLERVLVFGPPANEIMGPIEKVWCTQPARCAFWYVPRLDAGQNVERSFFEEALTALKHARMLNEARAAGQMQAPKTVLASAIHPILSFRASFVREVDRKPYLLQTAVLVIPDSQTGKPHIVDSRLASMIGYYRETLNVIDRKR